MMHTSAWHVSGKPLRIRLIRKTYFGFLEAVYLEMLTSQRPQVLNCCPVGITAYKAYIDNPLCASRSEKVPLWEPIFKGEQLLSQLWPLPFSSSMEINRWCSHSHWNIAPNIGPYSGMRASSLPHPILPVFSFSHFSSLTFYFYPLPS